MTNETHALAPPPPDFAARMQALDTRQSFLVRAPAGSGKTHLLTTRFLRLLAEVEDPREVVAITFTRAAAAEMRQRILSELHRAASSSAMDSAGSDAAPDPLRDAAQFALRRIRQMQWTVLEYPDQLRIQTIDSFCSSIASRAPLHWNNLTALGGSSTIAANALPLYRQAARRTISMIEDGPVALRTALIALLELRDGRWRDCEQLLCKMLAERARWFQDFVFDSNADSDRLRERLEAPMRHEAMRILQRLETLFEDHPGAKDETLALMRFAAGQQSSLYPVAAGLSEWPRVPRQDAGGTDLARVLGFHRELATFFLSGGISWRRAVDRRHGFPATDAGRACKQRFLELVARLQASEELLPLLQQIAGSAVSGYTDEEWQTVRHAFVVLRYAYAQLQLVFLDEAALDYSEVASLALRLMQRADQSPSDFALEFAAGIRHLLIDEFQDTSRKQYQLIDSIVAAWPGDDLRTCFCVGDPMQSIYGFRESDFELFDRPIQRGFGVEENIVGDDSRIILQPVQLTANFRSAPTLVDDLNERMASIFAHPGSARQADFSPAVAVREANPQRTAATTHLHLTVSADKSSAGGPPEWLALVREHWTRAERMRDDRTQAQSGDQKYRIALLARKKQTLIDAAAALESAGIPYLAEDLIPLSERMEVLDAVSLAQAALNPQDRLAWTSVLRAPWCALSLVELHRLISGDDREVKSCSVPELLEARLPLLREMLPADRMAALTRCVDLVRHAGRNRHRAEANLTGSWLHALWHAVGGALVTSALQQRNLELLWTALDQLPRGDIDLLERNPEMGWRAVVRSQTPSLDPQLDPRFGVHLMTIHRAKGLEFEVVILPELERRNATSVAPMLAWLERGNADPDQAELTEFLVAPIQRRGDERGGALNWVLAQKEAREAAEERRVFYVAATRAREELHLFASLRLPGTDFFASARAAKRPTLLQVIAPAFQAQISAALEDCAAAQVGTASDSGAHVASDEIADAVPSTGPRLVRLQPAAALAIPIPPGHRGLTMAATGGDEPLYERARGGLRSRAEGIAIHLLLQHCARLRVHADVAAVAERIAASAPMLVAHLRSLGVALREAQQIAGFAVSVVQRCIEDSTGRWILSPHQPAFTEASWTGEFRSPDGRSRWSTVRPDRCFLASAWQDDPDALPAWWIIDYKSTGGHLAGQLPREPETPATPQVLAPDIRQFVAEHRVQFAPQLEAYASLLQEILAAGSYPVAPVRLGIYYPLLRQFDHWSLDA